MIPCPTLKKTTQLEEWSSVMNFFSHPLLCNLDKIRADPEPWWFSTLHITHKVCHYLSCLSQNKFGTRIPMSRYRRSRFHNTQGMRRENPSLTHRTCTCYLSFFKMNIDSAYYVDPEFLSTQTTHDTL